MSPDHIFALQPILSLPINTPHPCTPGSYLKVSSMLGAQLGEELRGVWDVALENSLQPGQEREEGVKGKAREEGGRVRTRKGWHDVLPPAPQPRE